MGANGNGTAPVIDLRLSALQFSPLSASFQLYGYFDGVHGRCVDGWIFDAASPDSTLTVEIYDGMRLLGAARAGLFRADLDAIGIAGGDHAFRFELPAEIFDGNTHQIWVRVQNSGLTVPGSPRRLVTRPIDSMVSGETSDHAPALMTSRDDIVVRSGSRDDAIVRSLQAITEALTAQTRVLQALLHHAAPTAVDAAPIESPPSAVASTTDLLMAEILARPCGTHDFIMFGIIDWSFRKQRPQHLATRLAAMGQRVFYIGITFEPLTAGEPCFSVRRIVSDGVFEIALRCPPPAPSVYTGFDDPVQLGALAAAVRGLMRHAQLRSPVCILQLPTWYPVATALPGATLVFDCLDHLAGFANISPQVVALEQTVIDEADSVIVTSDFLADIVGRRRRFDVIRNGVEVRYFGRCPDSTYQPAGRPVIGYYGAIADWFDMALIERCARRHPKWHFVLIGAVDCCDVSRRAQLSNVELLGEKPYEELTRYLYAFDVCLIPFKLVDLTRATNPVKVYEYLCAGKPVVATDLPELRRLPAGMIEIAKSAAEFEKAIAATLRKKDPAAVRRRQLWASRHSWELRTRKLADVVARQFPPVSVVVTCFNNLQFTAACLESLTTFSDYPDVEFICVDNGSNDGTSDHLAELSSRDSRVRHIRNAGNLGFAGGTNVGMRVATGEMVILLNNDTYVTRGWMRDLIRPLQRHQDIGMAGPLTNMTGNEQKISIAYANMEEMAMASEAFTASRRRRLYPTENLAFFCVAIRRDVMDAVGELDEGFGTGYFEDDDYCRRVRRAGYRLVICDDVFVHHHHSASFDLLGNARKAELMKRNRRKFEARWGRWQPHTYRDEPGFGEA